jgi:hypothetical protein
MGGTSITRGRYEKVIHILVGKPDGNGREGTTRKI